MAANRKETPDILGDALGEKKTIKPVRQQNIKTEKHNTIKLDNKVKATYYLSQKAVGALEDTQYQLRKIAGENRARVSKSFIVEMAIQMALEDVESKGNKSRILKEVLR
jgi:hypothetical protein